MRSLSLASLGLMITLAGSMPAMSQGWQGFYGGVSIGYGKSTQETEVEGRSSGTVLPYGFRDGRNTGATSTPSGGMASVQMGYNWQTERALFGLEGDLSSASMKSDYVGPIQYLNGANVSGAYFRTHQEVKMLGSIRMRFGYTPSHRWLTYFTAGVAFADVDYASDMDYQNTPGPGYGFHLPASHSGIRAGYALGLGVEHAISRNISAKAEFIYYDISAKTVVGKATPTEIANDFQYTWNASAKVLRLGANFRF